jgi:superfamily II DNA or RNA helicase/HKD family nuclease
MSKVDYSFQDALEMDIRFGFLDAHVPARRHANPRLIVNRAKDDCMQTVLVDELKRARSFTFSVAFITLQALASIKAELIQFAEKHPYDGRIITSNYLGFNTPELFKELLGLREIGIDVRIYPGDGFHPKGYVFQNSFGMTAIMGSANLTANALLTNVEWNLKVTASASSALATEVSSAAIEQWDGAEELTDDWISRYESTFAPSDNRTPRRSADLLEEDEDAPEIIHPNAMQVEALRKISDVRRAGHDRALVISATGTGKTILSALDVREMRPRHFLYIAHREQILKKSMSEYVRVLGGKASDFGLVTGHDRELGRRYTFATVQSLSRPAVMSRLASDDFDYIVIDEAHRAHARSFREIMDFFTPDFYLGMTATPERSDGADVFQLFDYQVPYEIRLGAALDQKLLCPFHYYGVTDYETLHGETVSDTTGLAMLTASARVDHIVKQISAYGQAGVPVKGLMFCSRVEEARELSRELNERFLHGRRLRTVAVSGTDSQEVREQAIEHLESGGLDYLLSVDILNEGVDIPQVNQVVLLRQTKSPIVFVQQLGRGLRKAQDKDYLVVIDFIGNYTNNYMIPIALTGDRSLRKDSLRKIVAGSAHGEVLHGVSTIRFDRISRKRVLDSIATAKLGELRRLYEQFETLKERLGRVPRLIDFQQSDLADPVLVATRKSGNYPALRAGAMRTELEYTPEQLRMLTFVTCEMFASKRPHELCLLEYLCAGVESVSVGGISQVLAGNGLDAGLAVVESLIRVFTGEFNTSAERAKYGSSPFEFSNDGLRWTDEGMSWRDDPRIRLELDDLINTGAAVVWKRYGNAKPFKVGEVYSRKDASRQLNWISNQMATIYGYKVDSKTMTCPLFITYDKSEDVSASTAYKDRLVDLNTLVCFSKSRVLLESDHARRLLSSRVAKYVFIKKDDGEGSDFYYFGRGEVIDSEQEWMPGNDGAQLPVVKMTVRLEQSVRPGLFDYFEPAEASA